MTNKFFIFIDNAKQDSKLYEKNKNVSRLKSESG